MWKLIDDGTLDYDMDNDYSDEEDEDDILVTEGVEGYDGQVHTYFDEELEKVVIGPAMILSEFKRQVVDILNEYFESEDIEEVNTRILELNSPEYHYEFVKRAISLSLDRKEREKELVSRLLSDLYPKCIDSNHISKGFERLFEMQEDLSLDIPSAPKDLEAFLVRAVIDEILPPKFLSDPFIAGLGGDIIKNARNLLSREHVGAKIQKVWGPGDGRPVSELKIAIDQLLEEYLISQNLEEASICVKELNASYFHHELVKRAFTIASSKSQDSHRTSMSSLLSYLVATEVVSEEQIVHGFDRLHTLIDDLSLDVPNAPIYLEAFVEQAKSDGCLPNDYFPKGEES
jgi:programmed cell death protein 4